tara:strand:- start:420 stop:644 length:225 start_codon:yes stop_codon:yes gene_type:complete
VVTSIAFFLHFIFLISATAMTTVGMLDSGFASHTVDAVPTFVASNYGALPKHKFCGMIPDDGYMRYVSFIKKRL